MPGHNVTQQMADAAGPRIEDAPGGTSPLKPVQHLSCQGTLRERFHLSPSLQLGACPNASGQAPTRPGRPPRLCKLVPCHMLHLHSRAVTAARRGEDLYHRVQRGFPGPGPARPGTGGPFGDGQGTIPELRD